MRDISPILYFLIGILTSFLGTAAWVILQSRLSRIQHQQKTWRILLTVALFAPLVASFVLLLYVTWLVRPFFLSSGVVHFGVLVALGLIPCIVSCVLLTLELVRPKAQYGSPFRAQGKKPDSVGIAVRRLSAPINRETQTLVLNWPTVVDGLKYLKDQIAGCSPSFSPDVFVGINAVGMLIASYLSRTLEAAGQGLGTLGYIKTSVSGTNRFVQQKVLPALNKGPLHIMLVDSEVKSGESLRLATEELQKACGKGTDIDIRIAVLVAARVKKTKREAASEGIWLPELLIPDKTKGGRSVSQTDLDILPDFLAFVSDVGVKYPWEPE